MLLNSFLNFSIFEGIYFILVASLGIPTNLLSVVVLCGQRCGMSRSTVIYLVSLAIVDTLFMALGGLVDITASWLSSRQAPAVPLCATVSFNEGWTLCSSQWIVVAVTLERYLVSCGRRPCPGCRLSRPRAALLSVLALVLGSQILSLPFCWLYQARPGGDEVGEVVPGANASLAPLSRHCQLLPRPSTPTLLWLHAVMSGVLPMTLTLSLSVLATLHFRRRARLLVAPIGAAPFRSTGSRVRRSGRIQVTVALVAVFLALPRYVTQGLKTALGEVAGRHQGLSVAVGVALMLQWFSLVIHFLLYCFLSSGFRRETLALLRRLCRGPEKAWRRPIPPLSNQRVRALSTGSPPCQVWLVQDGYRTGGR